MPQRGPPSLDGRLRHHEGIELRARSRDLYGETVAEANTADLDWRQCRCCDPSRGAYWRLLVYQPAQHAGDDRAADGSVQAFARGIRQAVSGGSANATRGLRGKDPRGGDPPGTALPGRKIQSLSFLGPGQGDARGR